MLFCFDYICFAGAFFSLHIYKIRTTNFQMLTKNNKDLIGLLVKYFKYLNMSLKSQWLFLFTSLLMFL